LNTRFALIVMVALAACGPPDPPDRPGAVREVTPQELREAAQAFHTLRDGFLEWYHEGHPVRASELGIRLHDGRLPGMDRLSIQRRIDGFLDWEAQLSRIPLRLMRDEDRADHALLEYAIRSELLDLEELRLWVVDPVEYTELIARGLSALVERPDAALDVEALASRLAEAPAVLSAARSNLRSPPRLWTELAIEQGKGLLSWLETDLPALTAARGVSGPGAAVLDRGRAALVEALAEHVDWLEVTLLPVSAGDFRMGRYLLVRKLLYDEHVNLSVEELDRQNETAIATYRARLEEVAAEIDPARTPRAVLDSVMGLRPAPEVLLVRAREAMVEARGWVIAEGLVTVPSAETPVVRESPAHTPLQLTGLRGPGPFGEPGAGAYFEIRTAGPTWTEQERDQHLSYFHEGALPGIAAHETFPGRYVQRLHARHIENDLRKTLLSRTLTGGWPQYAEQRMIQEGFAADDPVVQLSHIRRTLQQHARWYAALHLHALGAPLDDVVERFMEIAHLDEFPARREVMAATRDPMYLAPALGRLQIGQLRVAYEAYLEERDEEFSARAFHDRLLQMGLPVGLATDAFMPKPPPEGATVRRDRRPTW
jgi:hypothetical protein